ncbi:MAG TPA: zf-HC2 domain-containing protein [Planosporangium sp.]|jgi:hypothetical protein|nr:zf-HC2 domain-containing protein [Planosporangium sp.]
MTHDHAAVAAYVAGDLSGGAHAEFEKHVLACEDCWREVELGRRGRRLAQLARESAPDELRQRVAAALVSAPRRRPRLSKLVVAATAACLVALAALVAVAVRSSPPTPVNAAIAEFRAGRLPGVGIPATGAPDLTKIGFTQTAAGAGDLAGVPVTAYAYQDPTGRRLLIYVGRRPFATPQDASRYEGGDAWIVREHGVSVLCSRHPHVTLVVGQDEQRVTDAAELLDLT